MPCYVACYVTCYVSFGYTLPLCHSWEINLTRFFLYFSLVLFFFNLSTSNMFHFGITVDQSTFILYMCIMLLYIWGLLRNLKYYVFPTCLIQPIKDLIMISWMRCAGS